MKRIQKGMLQLSDRFYPEFAAKKVYDVLSTPRMRKYRPFEEEILDQAEKSILKFNDFRIQTYKWGSDGRESIFLVHGWEGQAGNFGALIEPLLEMGYQVISFDGPSHGHSSRGETNMFQFADLVSFMLRSHQPTAVISHSFGSVTSLIAMSKNQDIPIKKWIMVTTPYDFKDRIRDIQNFLGLSERTMDKVISRMEESMGQSIDTMNMRQFAMSINHIQDALIVHSKEDKILPVEYARKTSKVIKQSRLIELEGYGHYSILWSKELRQIVQSTLN